MKCTWLSSQTNLSVMQAHTGCSKMLISPPPLFFPLCAIKALTVVLYLDLIFWYMYLLKISWLPFQRSRSSLARLLSGNTLADNPGNLSSICSTHVVRRDLTPTSRPLVSTHACMCVRRHVTQGNVTEINNPLSL